MQGAVRLTLGFSVLLSGFLERAKESLHHVRDLQQLCWFTRVRSGAKAVHTLLVFCS